MTEIRSADLTCSQCKAALEMHYRFVAEPPLSQHVLGCPECQSVQDIPDLVARLEREDKDRFLDVTALVHKTEIGVGAERAPDTPVEMHVPHKS